METQKDAIIISRKKLLELGVIALAILAILVFAYSVVDAPEAGSDREITFGKNEALVILNNCGKDVQVKPLALASAPSCLKMNRIQLLDKQDQGPGVMIVE